MAPSPDGFCQGRGLPRRSVPLTGFGRSPTTSIEGDGGLPGGLLVGRLPGGRLERSASIQSLFLLLCSGLFDHDCPDESQQFPRDRGHDDIRVFAVVAQLAKATAKPHLRLPGDRLDWGRRLLGTALNQPRAACREAIRPGAFEQQTASFLVACFGDRALTASRNEPFVPPGEVARFVRAPLSGPALDTFPAQREA